MQRKSFFILFFLTAIFWGLLSCGTIQIVREEKASPEKAPPKAASPEAAIPREAPRQETTREKGFLERVFEKISPQDTFTRTYASDFSSFHRQVNTALQDYARAHKGNSFQISRLGSDSVVLRGVYLREGGRERHVSTLTIKPAGSQKCQVEIKFSSAGGNELSANAEEAAKEIFQIIDRATSKK